MHSNVSFLFYLRGWSGITVEPNPWLAQLSEAVRPRDRRIDSLLGAAPGQAIYHLVEGFHGLSTTVEANAQAAQKEFNRPVKSFPVPVTTLRALCEPYAPKRDRLPQDRRRGRRAGRAGRQRLGRASGPR